MRGLISRTLGRIPMTTTIAAMVVGAVILSVGAVVLAVYVNLSANSDAVAYSSQKSNIRTAATVVGALVAAMLLGWFGSGVVLLGGLVNEEWAAAQRDVPGGGAASGGDAGGAAREDGGDQRPRGRSVRGARVGEEHQVDGAELGQADAGGVPPSLTEPVPPAVEAQR